MGWNTYGDDEFSGLKGETITKIIGGTVGSEEIIFELKSGKAARLLHHQSCCEGCYVEDICGELSDLLNEPLLLAEVVTSDKNPPDAKPETIEYQDSFTWTFYKLATVKGAVTIRWYGSSNGYYSESVDFEWQGGR